jgi:hypothetical protein
MAETPSLTAKTLSSPEKLSETVDRMDRLRRPILSGRAIMIAFSVSRRRRFTYQRNQPDPGRLRRTGFAPLGRLAQENCIKMQFPPPTDGGLLHALLASSHFIHVRSSEKGILFEKDILFWKYLKSQFFLGQTQLSFYKKIGNQTSESSSLRPS